MSHIVRGDFHSEVATKKLLEHNTIDYIRLTIKEATESIDKHLIQLGDTLDRKFLHAVLDFAPTLDGKLNVACHILSPDWEKQNPEYTHLKHLANFYHENLMQPMRGRAHLTAGYVANMSNGDLFGNAIPLTPEAVDRVSKKDECLVRDGGRCIVSGKKDPKAVPSDTFSFDDRGNLEITQAAHIMPYALNAFKPAATEKAKHIWTALQEFSGYKLENLMGSGINEPSNIITLSATLHVAFDDLLLCFEPMDEHNVYGIHAWEWAEYALPKNFQNKVT